MTSKITRRSAISEAIATTGASGTIPQVIESVLAAEAELEVDTLLEGGTIVDGSGAPPFVGNVALCGDKIVAVGPAALPVERCEELAGKAEHGRPGPAKRRSGLFLSAQEFLTEGHEYRKGLFTSRTLRPSVQPERKGGSRILFGPTAQATDWFVAFFHRSGLRRGLTLGCWIRLSFLRPVSSICPWHSGAHARTGSGLAAPFQLLPLGR